MCHGFSAQHYCFACFKWGACLSVVRCGLASEKYIIICFYDYCFVINQFLFCDFFFTHRHAVDIIFMIIRYVYADWWTLDIDILLTLLDSPFTVKHTAYLIFYGAQTIIVSVYICMYFDFNFGFSIWIHIFHRRSYSCNFEREWNFPVHSFGKFTKFSRWIKHTRCS